MDFWAQAPDAKQARWRRSDRELTRKMTAFRKVRTVANELN
jgi:hypothetical protein